MKATKAIALASATAIVLAACGSDSDPEATEDTTATEEAAEESTEEAAEESTEEAAPTDEAVCPSNMVIQTDWLPELEHGGTYQLIGPNGTASKDTVSYSGPVQEQYAVGGLETLEIRTVNFDKSNASVLADGDADMAYLTSSDIIKDSGAIPLVGIAKTLDQDPQMIMWDPAVHDVSEPADLAGTGAQLLHFPGSSYVDYMISEGIITEDQSNPSYDGSDGAWVAAGGDFIQQGFATNEIYKYENDIAWKDGGPADVSFFTVGDLGFENYPAVITMLQSRAEELDACLQLLVPAMSQAWVDFLADPTPVTDRLITINEEYDGFWSLSEGLNAAGIGLVESEGYALNSADGTYCSLDTDRLQTLYDILAPIYADQGTEIADGIDSIFTDKYCAGAPGR